MKAIEPILRFLADKSVLLLGMGREGRSSLRFLQTYMPQTKIGIADKNTQLDLSDFDTTSIKIILGDNYLEAINDFDIVIKSPGISLKNTLVDVSKITSQTDLFLQAFGKQSIAVTGTKGKSTTSSFINHVLSQIFENVLFGGNIGLPLLDLTDKIDSKTIVVLELSSHQLEYIHRAPHIAVLLNLFEEHLDHYVSYTAYQKAKYNIALKQDKQDFFIYNNDDKEIAQRIAEQPFVSRGFTFSAKTDENVYSFCQNNQFFLKKDGKVQLIKTVNDSFPLKGKHNEANICAAIAALSCIDGVDVNKIGNCFDSFKPLHHRMELLGTYEGIVFYNDSISTIPQASIAAVEALQNVDTLILGGMDRGIDYQILADYFTTNHAVRHFIFVGKAGERMFELFTNNHIENLYKVNDYHEVVKIAKQVTQKGKICLLSPAAPSYDQFKNFEQRGEVFELLIKKE